MSLGSKLDCPSHISMTSDRPRHAAAQMGAEPSTIHFISDDEGFYRDVARASACWVVLLQPAEEDNVDDGLHVCLASNGRYRCCDARIEVFLSSP